MVLQATIAVSTVIATNPQADHCEPSADLAGSKNPCMRVISSR